MLCTRTDLKDYLGIENIDSTSNTLLFDLIDSESVEIETYCMRMFANQIYTEYHSGEKVASIYTSEYPITSVSGIWSDTSLEWDDDALIDNDEYVVFSDHIQLKDTYFTAGQDNIKITYVAGYTTIPLDLQQVCIEEAGIKFKRRYDYDVIARTKGDIGSEVIFVEKGFLEKNKLVLNKYKKRFIC